MHPLTHSAFRHEDLAILLAMIGFGAYHGLNPGMGWLFALSRGMQLQNGRAVWSSLIPIALGHAASITMVALLVIAIGGLIDPAALRVTTAAIVISFGLYKLFRYYRHPRWVGMEVGNWDLFLWSFLMASGHGAGLMVAPLLLAISSPNGNDVHAAVAMLVAVALHTAAMLAVMGLVAWIVYRKLGLAVLRKGWVNFDLIWAAALLVVGVLALYPGMPTMHH